MSKLNKTHSHHHHHNPLPAGALNQLHDHHHSPSIHGSWANRSRRRAYILACSLKSASQARDCKWSLEAHSIKKQQKINSWKIYIKLYIMYIYIYFILYIINRFENIVLLFKTSRSHPMKVTLFTCWFISRSALLGCKNQLNMLIN